MWEWLWDWTVGRSWKDFEESVRENMNRHQEALHRNTMALEETVVRASGHMRNTTCYIVAHLARSLPVLMKMKNAPDELADL